jgi:hypothetical protein
MGTYTSQASGDGFEQRRTGASLVVTVLLHELALWQDLVRFAEFERNSTPGVSEVCECVAS